MTYFSFSASASDTLFFANTLLAVSTFYFVEKVINNLFKLTVLLKVRFLIRLWCLILFWQGIAIIRLVVYRIDTYSSSHVGASSLIPYVFCCLPPAVRMNLLIRVELSHFTFSRTLCGFFNGIIFG